MSRKKKQPELVTWKDWVVRAVLLVALVAAGYFDIKNNYVVLSSGWGAFAMTVSGLAFSLCNKNLLTVPLMILCPALSGAYNYSALTADDREAQNKYQIQTQIKAAISEAKLEISNLKSNMYSEREINDCWNDIVQGEKRRCISQTLIDHNEMVLGQIEPIQNRLNKLKEKVDYSIVKPSEFDKGLSHWISIATAIILPFSLVGLGTGLSFSFSLTERENTEKTNANWLQIFANKSKSDANQKKYDSENENSKNEATFTNLQLRDLQSTYNLMVK